MKLLLIRHAIAEDREEFAKTGEPDAKRPLTADGRKKMKRAARGLADIVAGIDLIASSPLTRAMETAVIVSEQFGAATITTIGALEPEQRYDAFLEWLLRLDVVGTVAGVGHEPHLSGLASWLLTGNENPIFEFKKGGMCLLEFDAAPASGSARLRWLLTPAQLRSIAG